MTQDIVQAKNTWLKLSSIVDLCCNRVDLSVNHYYQKFLEFAKWELMQLKLDRANEPKTYLLDISDTNTVKVPADIIDVSKVGIPFGQYVKTIGINGDLSRIDRTIGNPDFSYSVSPSWLPNGISVADYGGGWEFANYGGRALFAIDGSLPNEGHYTVRKCDGFLE